MSVNIVVSEPEALSEAEESVKVQEPLAQLTLEELQAEIARRTAIKEEEEIREIAANPPGKAPVGFRWVFNRLPDRFEWQYNSIGYSVAGYAYALEQTVVAQHGRKHSILLLDPITQKAIFQLALDGEEGFGRPLKMRRRAELLDRSTSDNLTPFASSDKTRVAVLELNDIKAMMSRRMDSYVELE